MSVGATLSQAREALGLSLADVSADTRIRSTVIAAIENDDYDACGGAVYARGHLRSIARVVGVDPEPLIAEFDASHQLELPAVSAVVAPQPTDPDLLSRTGRAVRPNWTVAMGVALVAICAFALVGLLVSRGGGGKSPHHVTTALGSNATQTASPPATPPPTTVAEVPASKATMEIRAQNGQTWLSVTTKNGARTLFYGLLPAGQDKLFTNRHGLSFVIGNAPAVDVVVNGHDIGTPPSDGSVARGSVAPGSDTVQQA